MDDEDELLYGEPGAADKGPQKMAGKAAPWWVIMLINKCYPQTVLDSFFQLVLKGTE